jgi:hypothetical protein
MRSARPLVVALLVAVAVGHVGACSSNSTPIGAGACDAYCQKIVGAKCKNPPSRELCLDECQFHVSDCHDPQVAFLRCATIDANIACDSGNGQPRVQGCDTYSHALQNDPTCHVYVPDAALFLDGGEP